MPLAVVDLFETVKVCKDDADRPVSVPSVLAADKAVNTVVQSVAVKNARKKVLGAEHLEPVEQLIVSYLRCEKIRGKLQHLLYLHRLRYIEVYSPDIAERFVTVSQREKDNALCARRLHGIVPDGICLFKVLPVVLVFYNNAGVSADSAVPRFDHVEEIIVYIFLH